MLDETVVVPQGAVQVQRIFEQPADAISFYCETAQILGTPNELVLQFYESIPGPPGPTGNIGSIRCRLRATITFSLKHAQKIGQLLGEKVGEEK